MKQYDAEAQRRADPVNTLLELFAQTSSRSEYLEAVVELVQGWSGCRCVGLRVLDEEGNIPYESYLGFSREFWESENWLSVDRDQCACIRVIKGTPEPQDIPAMTAAGSFRCDNAISYVDGLSREERARFRGVCVRCGFASIAIVPVNYRGKVIGALHLADEGEGKLPRKLVEFLESMSPLLGEAIHRFNLEDELRRNHDAQAAINWLLRLSLEDISLGELLNRTLDLILGIPWLPFESGGSIHLVEEGIGIPVRDPRHYQLPIRSGGRVLGIMTLPLREGRMRRQRDEQFLAAVADVLAGILLRKRAEEALRQSEARYRRLAENAQDLIYRYEVSPLPGFSYLSSAIEGMLGYTAEDLCGEPGLICQIADPEDRQGLEALLAGHSVPPALTVRWRHRDGNVVWAELRNVPVHEDGRLVAIEGIARDVTEREQMTEKILRAERLEMAGRIAGQVAHDLSNLLSPLVGYPQLIKRHLPPDHPAIRYCDILHGAARQMAAINEDLLTLGRRGRLGLEPGDLNQLVEQVVLQMPEAPSTLEVRLDLAPGPLLVRCLPAQLSRVISNLLSNARDSMQEAGRLTVRTEKMTAEKPVGRYGQVEAGEYVRLTVSDRGCGIPPDLLDRIFDPFFTTKRAERRRGSGLGLSIVQAIVQDHRGFIDVESEVGKGSSFSVYLPVSSA